MILAGDQIVIEERSAREITHVQGVPVTPEVCVTACVHSADSPV